MHLEVSKELISTSKETDIWRFNSGVWILSPLCEGCLAPDEDFSLLVDVDISASMAKHKRRYISLQVSLDGDIFQGPDIIALNDPSLVLAVLESVFRARWLDAI